MKYNITQNGDWRCIKITLETTSRGYLAATKLNHWVKRNTPGLSGRQTCEVDGKKIEYYFECDNPSQPLACSFSLNYSDVNGNVIEAVGRYALLVFNAAIEEVDVLYAKMEIVSECYRDHKAWHDLQARVAALDKTVLGFDGLAQSIGALQGAVGELQEAHDKKKRKAKP